MQALFSHSSPSFFCSSCIEDQVTFFCFFPKCRLFREEVTPRVLPYLPAAWRLGFSAFISSAAILGDSTTPS